MPPGRDAAAEVHGRERELSTATSLSKPATFSGGTIHTADSPGGSIRIQGVTLAGDWPKRDARPVQRQHGELASTRPVGSVRLEAETNAYALTTHLTLTGYDVANAVVASDTKTQTGCQNVVTALSVGREHDYVDFTNNRLGLH
jgi:hypothetical protein